MTQTPLPADGRRRRPLAPAQRVRPAAGTGARSARRRRPGPPRAARRRADALVLRVEADRRLRGPGRSPGGALPDGQRLRRRPGHHRGPGAGDLSRPGPAQRAGPTISPEQVRQLVEQAVAAGVTDGHRLRAARRRRRADHPGHRGHRGRHADRRGERAARGAGRATRSSPPAQQAGPGEARAYVDGTSTSCSPAPSAAAVPAGDARRGGPPVRAARRRPAGRPAADGVARPGAARRAAERGRQDRAV